MRDPRTEKLARVLVDYSLAVRKGTRLRIGGSAGAGGVLREVYRRALHRGALVSASMGVPGTAEILLKEGSRAQLGFDPPEHVFVARKYDAHLSLGSPENTRALSGCDPVRQRLAAGARRKWQKVFFGREARGELRWCYSAPPCQALAMDADMSLAEFEDFYYRACLCHRRDPVAAWKRVARRQQKLASRLSRAREVRVVAPGTDLTVGVAKRRFINCCGTCNMPDGEVFTSPLEDSAEGTIRFTYPAIHGGREVDGVRLAFRAGKVVDASAAKNETYLYRMLDSDAGARRLGEFALGTNYDIKSFTKSILFDEKIGGTVHLAVGMSYPLAGGRNRSAIHWDMVCDLRKGGAVYADGKLIQKNGRFRGGLL
ncbi:MAG: aminopeptidase [Planctomycetota bacterium]|jgi:aminopeptidase